jgi:hypothetical protein
MTSFLEARQFGEAPIRMDILLAKLGYGKDSFLGQPYEPFKPQKSL